MKKRLVLPILLGFLGVATPLTAQDEPPSVSQQVIDVDLLRAVLEHELRTYGEQRVVVIEPQIAGIGRKGLSRKGAPIWQPAMIGELARSLGITVKDYTEVLRCPDPSSEASSGRCTFGEGTDVVVSVGIPSIEGDTAEVRVSQVNYSREAPLRYQALYSGWVVYRAVRDNGSWKVDGVVSGFVQ